jgi:hypothetical protein
MPKEIDITDHVLKAFDAARSNPERSSKAWPARSGQKGMAGSNIGLPG